MRRLMMPKGERGLFDRLFLSLAVAVFLADQLTKAWVTATLGPAAERHYVPVIGDYLRLVYTTNTGAAFGMLQNQSWLFALIAVIAIPAILLFNRSVAPRNVLTRVCLGALMGGTFGNLTDRLRLGYVVDFVDAGVGPIRWWAFNVADSAFVIGIAVLCAYMFFAESTAPEQTKIVDQTHG